MKSGKQETQWVNQTRAEELAQDPRNKVYQHVYSTPSRLYTAEESQQEIKEIRDRYVDLVVENRNATDAEIRRAIVADPITGAKHKVFYQNHKKLFAFITSRDTTAEKMQHIYVMLFTKQREEKGILNEADAQSYVSQYLLNSFKTSSDEASKAKK